MSHLLRQLFALNSANKNIRRQQLFLYSVSVAGLIATIGILIAGVLVSSLPTMMVAGTILVIIAILFYLTRRQILGIPSLVYPLVTYIAITILFVVEGGGSHDIVILAYPLAIVLAGLLLGPNGTLLFTGLTLMSIWTIMFGEINGRFLYPLSETTTYADIIIISAIYGLTGALLYITIRSLNSSLQEAQESELAIARSNEELEQIRASLEDRVAERTERAEIAKHEAEAARHEIENQMWFTTGQAQLSSMLYGDQSSADIAANAIGHLCTYLDAVVGALFMIQNEEIHLLSSYALDQDAVLAQHLHESFLGETAVSQQPRLLTDLPANYLTLPTSVGDVQITAVLLQPIIYNQQTIAVIELGFLQPITEQQHQFMNVVKESIAVAFYTAQARERVNLFLQEKQQRIENPEYQAKTLGNTDGSEPTDAYIREQENK